MKKSNFLRFGLLLAFSFQLMLLSYCKKYPVNIPERIVKKLVLVVPNGGEELLADSAFAIEWEQENIDSICIEYSVDSGNSWQFITGDAIPSAGRYEWVVPKIESTDYMVRVIDKTDSLLNDTSDATFSVVDIEKLHEQLSYYPLSMGDKWIYRVTRNNGECNLRIGYKLREVVKDTIIKDKNYSYVRQQSNISGNGYEFLRIDKKVRKVYRFINYAGVNKEYAIIDLSSEKDDISRAVPIAPEWGGRTSFTNIYSDTIMNTLTEFHSFDWNGFEEVGTYELAKDFGLVKFQKEHTLYGIVSDLLVGCYINNVVYGDTSIAPYDPVYYGLKVLSPNGGEVYQAGSTIEIKWSNPNPSCTIVWLEFSQDNGRNWIQLGEYHTGGLYNWEIPNNIQSDSCLISIQGMDSNSGTPPYDRSDGLFRIIP